MKPTYLDSKRLILLTFLCSWVFQAAAQTDSLYINAFLKKQHPEEALFIQFVKDNKIDSALSFVSPQLLERIGKKKMITEMNRIYRCFSKYKDQNVKKSIGIPKNNVGAFGHSTNAKVELRSQYLFYDEKKNLTYSFSIYYNSLRPLKYIKDFHSVADKEEPQLVSPDN